MKGKATVLVIDKYPIVRWALKKYFSNHNKIVILDAVKSIAEASASMKLRSPEVVVMDICCPETGGIKMVSKMVEQIGAKIVAFSDVVNWNQVEDFYSAGGLGLVPRQSALEDMATAIEAAANKQQWIAPAVREVSFEKNKTNKNSLLSARECEIIALIADGLTSKQIADQLCLSINTIESHRKRIFKKLDVHHCAQLGQYAIEHNLTQTRKN